MNNELYPATCSLKEREELRQLYVTICVEATETAISAHSMALAGDNSTDIKDLSTKMAAIVASIVANSITQLSSDNYVDKYISRNIFNDQADGVSELFDTIVAIASRRSGKTFTNELLLDHLQSLSNAAFKRVSG